MGVLVFCVELMMIGGLGYVVVNSGNAALAGGAVLEPNAKTGCVIPASDGGTAAAAIAGPTKTPAGIAPIGGGVGGGKVGGGPPPWPIRGGGTIGVKSGNVAGTVPCVIVKARPAIDGGIGEPSIGGHTGTVSMP